MIEATRRWFRRNRTNLLVGAGVLGAGYLAGQYVLGRIREATQRRADDRVSKDNLRRRFETNQEDCTYTVLALLPTIRDEIIGALPVELITEQLQQERQERLKRLSASEAASSEFPSAPPSTIGDASTASFVHTSQLVGSTDELRPKRSKAQLWQEMKINSIARALALLYTLAVLNLLTRIQLNLLGRRTYLSSVVSMAAPPADIHGSTISLEDRDESTFDSTYGNDFETNRMYLTFSWWILHRGAKSILDKVMAAVKDVFGQVNIREDMTLERLSELIIEVRKRVEGATEQERRSQSWLEYLLPPRNEELFVINQANSSDNSDSASPEPRSDPMDVKTISKSLRRLLDETADLIDSPTFSLVLGRLLDTGFSHLIDVRIASEAFKTNPTDNARIVELSDTRCKLAHILPIFCRQAHAIVLGAGEIDAQQPANEYLVLMDRVHDLEAFAAVIYSSNFEYESGDERPEVEVDESVLQHSTISMVDSVALENSAVLSNASQMASTAFESAWNKAVHVAEEINITDASLVDLSEATAVDNESSQTSVVEPSSAADKVVKLPVDETLAEPTVEQSTVIVPTMEAASEHESSSKQQAAPASTTSHSES